MNLQFITDALMNLSSLAKNFNKEKAQALISQLKAAKPDDLNKLMDLIKPLAGGKVHALLTQLISKIDQETIAQFQKTLSGLNVSDLQNVIRGLTQGGINDIMGKAKDLFGNLLNKK